MNEQDKKNETARTSNAATYTGTVVSNAMTQTLVVAVADFKKHAKYHKRYKSTKKYKVHDDTEEYNVGDTVVFVECKPMSKDKRYRVVAA